MSLRITAVRWRESTAGWDEAARVADLAFTLPSAAHPSTAHSALLVEGNKILLGATWAARLASVGPSACHEANWIGGRCLGVLVPAVEVVNHRNARDAIAPRAGLVKHLPLFLRAQVHWGVVFVLAQILVGTIGAIFDAIAALLVRDDFTVRAKEPVAIARASDVVAPLCRSLG